MDHIPTTQPTGYCNCRSPSPWTVARRVEIQQLQHHKVLTKLGIKFFGLFRECLVIEIWTTALCVFYVVKQEGRWCRGTIERNRLFQRTRCWFSVEIGSGQCHGQVLSDQRAILVIIDVVPSHVFCGNGQEYEVFFSFTITSYSLLECNICKYRITWTC